MNRTPNRTVGRRRSFKRNSLFRQIVYRISSFSLTKSYFEFISRNYLKMVISAVWTCPDSFLLRCSTHNNLDCPSRDVLTPIEYKSVVLVIFHPILVFRARLLPHFKKRLFTKIRSEANQISSN